MLHISKERAIFVCYQLFSILEANRDENLMDGEIANLKIPLWKIDFHSTLWQLLHFLHCHYYLW